MLHFFAAVRAARRAMETDQQRPHYQHIPLYKLIAGEIALLARRRGTRRVVATILAVAVSVAAVEILLTDVSPGPVFRQPWRWIIAVGVAALVLVGWTAVHAIRTTDTPIRPPS